MNKITKQSKIGELYNTTVGHDALEKVLLQLNIPTSAITNPVVSNIKIEGLEKILGKKLGDGFFDAMIQLVNTDTEAPFVSTERPSGHNKRHRRLYPCGQHKLSGSHRGLPQL